MDAALLSFVLALATAAPACPMSIGIGGDGALYSDHFHGWYKISAKTLKSDLQGGCYPDPKPRPVSSVRLLIAPNAPKPKIDLVLSILEKEGWAREKIGVEKWSTYPQAPH